MSVMSVRIRIFEDKYLKKTVSDSGLVPIGSLQESAQGESNGYITDDVMWPDDIIAVTS